MAFDASNYYDGRRAPINPNQAKLLTDEEYEAVVKRVMSHPKFALRNLAVLQLSHKAALRAHEIAGLGWRHVTHANGAIAPVVTITDDIAKGGAGRIVDMSDDLRDTLTKLRRLRRYDVAVAHPLQGECMTTSYVTPAAIHKFFERLYEEAGLEGASSHSGRRSAITRWGRNANLHGFSLRDVQRMAGHASLRTTQQYIDLSPAPRSALVNV